MLSDLGQLKTPEGQVVIGAAVFDDVVGWIILSVVSSMVAGAELSLGGIGVTAEYDLGLYLKRGRVLAQALGDATFHRDRYAALKGF